MFGGIHGRLVLLLHGADGRTISLNQWFGCGLRSREGRLSGRDRRGGQGSLHCGLDGLGGVVDGDPVRLNGGTISLDQRLGCGDRSRESRLGRHDRRGGQGRLHRSLD